MQPLNWSKRQITSEEEDENDKSSNYWRPTIGLFMGVYKWAFAAYWAFIGYFGPSYLDRILVCNVRPKPNQIWLVSYGPQLTYWAFTRSPFYWWVACFNLSECSLSHLNYCKIHNLFHCKENSGEEKLFDFLMSFFFFSTKNERKNVVLWTHAIKQFSLLILFNI